MYDIAYIDTLTILVFKALNLHIVWEKTLGRMLNYFFFVLIKIQKNGERN